MNRAIVLYMPVIHKGYENFLNDFKDVPVYVMSEKVLNLLANCDEEKLRSVVRDQRGILQERIVSYLESVLGIDARVLEADDIPHLKSYDEIIMLRDTVSEVFVHELSAYVQSVQFANCFTRWDRMHTLNKDEDITDNTISVSEMREFGFFRFIETAEKEASKSPDWWRQVGSVLVKGGEQVLTAFNQHLPTEYESYFSGDPRANFNAGEYIELSLAAHSEASLIAQAARKGISTEGSELFVTTFPCPPCAKSVALAGIKRVYFWEGYSIVDSVGLFREFGVELWRVVK